MAYGIQAIVMVSMFLGAGGPAAAQGAPVSEGPFVVVCPIDEMVDDGLVVLVERAVREAEGAEALIFVVDTYGGKVDSADAITRAIVDAPCTTIAFVQGRGAISAGALISFACNEIIMEPATNIGAAMPVVMSAEGALPTGEKEVSFLRSKMQALAEVNGHNPALGLAMVDKDVELLAARDEEGRVHIWTPTFGDPPPEEVDVLDQAIDAVEDQVPVSLEPVRKLKDAILEKPSDEAPAETLSVDASELRSGEKARVVLPKGKLLTLTAGQALHYGLIPATAENLDEVLAVREYYGARQVLIETTVPEAIFRWLTNPAVSGVLLMIALGGLYLEIKTPGIGLPGIISVVAFALFFGARAVLGLADWIDLALIIIGVALILTEIFVIPGFGFVGVAGIVCLATGLILSFVLTDFTWPSGEWGFYSWTVDRLYDAGIAAGTSMGLLVVFVLATWTILPRTPAYRHIVLTSVQDADQGFAVQTDRPEEVVGLEGVALTVLRPAGKGRFGDRTLQVMSRSDYVPADTPIVIVRREGNRYVVDIRKEEA